MRCDTVDVGEVVPRDANARIGGDVPHANRGVPASGQEQERHLVVPRRGRTLLVAAERAVFLDRTGCRRRRFTGCARPSPICHLTVSCRPRGRGLLQEATTLRGDALRVP